MRNIGIHLSSEHLEGYKKILFVGLLCFGDILVLLKAIWNYFHPQRIQRSKWAVYGLKKKMLLVERQNFKEEGEERSKWDA